MICPIFIVVVLMGRIRKAEAHRISSFCNLLVSRGLQDSCVKFLASGRYSDCFRIQLESSEIVAKVSTYREGCLQSIARATAKGNLAKAEIVYNSDAVTIGNRLRPILNLLLNRETTPHLVWGYGDYDCKNFIETALRSRLCGPMRKRLRNIKKEGGVLQAKYCNISFHEKFTYDLTDFLNQHDVSEYALKCILFQIVHTIACLQDIMPGFRHNDLSTNNIFVKLLSKGDVCYDEYVMNGSSFYTHIPHILVAIADWDFAHCQEPFEWAGKQTFLRNERVVGGAYELKPSPNPTFDVHYFFTTVLQQIRRQPRKYGETIAFLRKSCGTWNDRTDILLPRLNPTHIIEQPYFDYLREKPTNGVLNKTYVIRNTLAPVEARAH